MSYVVAGVAGLISGMVMNYFDLPFWPALGVFVVGYLGGRIVGAIDKKE